MAALIVSAIAGSCAIVDQFEERIYGSNLESQNAMNQETLLNIIRASRYQTMNFIALTQVSGGQQETLSTGLPTITIGPAQTVAQHQFQVSNSLSSQATGNFQSNPLVSTTFQSAMLSPVSPRTVALLAASHPREAVFYSLLDAIVLSDGKFIVRFENNEVDATGASLDVHCSRLGGDYTRNDLQLFEGYCNYAAFTEMLRLLMSSGLTAELQPVENVAQKDAPLATGHICFDRSRRVIGYDASPVCGETKPVLAPVPKPARSVGSSPAPDAATAAPPIAAKPVAPKPSTNFQRLTIRGVGTFDVTFSFRSPVSVYRFYGTLFGQGGGGHYRYQASALKHFFAENEPFIAITSDASSGCYTSVTYGSQFFCVPSYAKNTALLFTMLQELRNLSIQSTDLNSAFTVRLAN
jgi:hypothetical protein